MRHALKYLPSTFTGQSKQKPIHVCTHPATNDTLLLPTGKRSASRHVGGQDHRVSFKHVQAPRPGHYRWPPRPSVWPAKQGPCILHSCKTVTKTAARKHSPPALQPTSAVNPHNTSTTNKYWQVKDGPRETTPLPHWHLHPPRKYEGPRCAQGHNQEELSQLATVWHTSLAQRQYPECCCSAPAATAPSTARQTHPDRRPRAHKDSQLAVLLYLQCRM